MGRINRNIITAKDVQNYLDPASPNPRTLTASPPAGQAPAAAAAAAAAGGGAAPGGVTVPTEDDYLTTLIKYIPIEVLGAYLFVQGIVNSNVTAKHDLAVWLGVLLGGFAIVVALYDWRVLNIVRPEQILGSMIAFGVYVFAFGGWFATTTWYHQWYAAIVLPAFALLVALIPIRPLPT